MGQHTFELTDANFTSTIEQAEVPMLVDFWAPWCQPCRLLTPIVEQLAEAYSGRLSVGKLNTEDAPSVAAQFKIHSIPTLLFFKNGQVVDSVVGLLSKDKLQQKVEEVLAR